MALTSRNVSCHAMPCNNHQAFVMTNIERILYSRLSLRSTTIYAGIHKYALTRSFSWSHPVSLSSVFSSSKNTTATDHYTFLSIILRLLRSLCCPSMKSLQQQCSWAIAHFTTSPLPRTPPLSRSGLLLLPPPPALAPMPATGTQSEHHRRLLQTRAGMKSPQDLNKQLCWRETNGVLYIGRRHQVETYSRPARIVATN